MEAFFIHIANKLNAVRFPAKSGSKIFDVEELKSPGLWRAVLAEFVAQVLFLLLVMMSAIYPDPATATDTKLIKISLTFGLAIMGLAEVVGHVSGGHINPAVTIAMAVVRNISIPRAVLYVLAQVVGAIVGALLAKGLTPEQYHSQGWVATSLAPGVTVAQGFGIEMFLTFVLVLVVFGTTDSNKVSFGSPAVHIGFTVALLHLSAIQYTGCAINPSRALGASLAADKWEDHWVYWVGPICGGILAAVLYKFVLNPYRGGLTVDEALHQINEEAPRIHGGRHGEAYAMKNQDDTDLKLLHNASP